MKLTKLQRECIRQKFGCRCAYCGIELGEKFHVDHLVPVKRDFEFVKNPHTGNYQTRSTGVLGNPEADSYENLMPACARCNLNKHSMSLEGWRNSIENFLTGLNGHSKYAMYQHAKRFGMVVEAKNKVVFWFEQFLKGSTGMPVSVVTEWHKFKDKKPEVNQTILVSFANGGYSGSLEADYEHHMYVRNEPWSSSVSDEDMWCAMPTPTGGTNETFSA